MNFNMNKKKSKHEKNDDKKYVHWIIWNKEKKVKEQLKFRSQDIAYTKKKKMKKTAERNVNNWGKRRKWADIKMNEEIIYMAFLEYCLLLWLLIMNWLQSHVLLLYDFLWLLSCISIAVLFLIQG